jgi:uncharacterized protein (TIGR02453 family)
MSTMPRDTVDVSAFAGWPPEAVAFYAGLEADNSKAYWTAHKATYDAAVRAPMEALVEALAPEFGEASIFRPYRDTRFSASKAAYKTNAAAAVGGFGKPAYYVSLSAHGLEAGGGLHAPDPAQLATLRAAIDDDRLGAELVSLVDEAEGRGLELAGEAVKTAPRGYRADHPRIALLRRKELVVIDRWPVARWLHTPEALDRVRDVWRAVRPLNEWVEAHVPPLATAARRSSARGRRG